MTNPSEMFSASQLYKLIRDLLKLLHKGGEYIFQVGHNQITIRYNKE